MTDAGVPNHDWARYVGESTSDTINRLAPSYLRVHPLELTDIYTLVHQVAATELEKLAHRYISRSGMIAPNNVAYHLSQKAQEIKTWKPTWWMVALYKDGSTDEYPIPGANAEDAHTELSDLRKMPGVREAKVELR